MTEDYKKQLLNYITGNFGTETGDNTPYIVNNQTLSTSYKDQIENILGNNEFFQEQGFLEFTNTDKKIVYGFAYVINSYDPLNITSRGIMIIVDENLQYLGYVDEYSSGTKFNRFEMLKVDENNLIYGVDNTGTNNNAYRFIMLNDVISTYLLDGNYTCILRQSYYFPSSYNSISFYRYTINGFLNDSPTMSNKNRIYKEYEGSSYAFIGKTTNNYPTIITLQVNVGEANEWHQYTSNYGINDDKGIASACTWQNDTINLKIGCFSISTDEYGSNYYEEFSFNGTTLSRTKNVSCSGIKAIEMSNISDTYILQCVEDAGKYFDLNYLTFSGNSLVVIDTTKIVGNTTNAWCYSVNGVSFFAFYLFSNNSLYCDAITSLGVAHSQPIDENLIGVLYVSNYFNFYKMTALTENGKVVNFALDYNANNYNGYEYIDYNSFIPKKVVLYNNNDLIFSRNLYNETILNNTTIATAEIPNTMLNNTEINTQNLLSETNFNMVQNNNIITKNVYETIFLNFINTINVSNEDTQTNLPSDANYINTNINTGTQTNYNNTYIGKIRINTTTPTIQPITWYNLDDTHLMTNFPLSVSEAIPTIDFISNDETTTYLTIDTSNTEIGKDYVISQKIRME